jgi:hypothetical protein
MVCWCVKDPIVYFFWWWLCFLESPKEGVAALLVSARTRKLNFCGFETFDLPWTSFSYLRFWYGGTSNLQVNKQTHDSILVANHVCDYVKNAHHQWVHSWYQSYYVYQLVLDPINNYMSISLYTQSIFFQSYIPYHIYRLEKCCDTIMHMVSKFWRTPHTSTRLVKNSFIHVLDFY